MDLGEHFIKQAVPVLPTRTLSRWSMRQREATLMFRWMTRPRCY